MFQLSAPRCTNGSRLLTSLKESHLTPGNGVQIIGKVNSDLSIKVMSSLDLGSNVGMSIFLYVVNCTHPLTKPADYSVAQSVVDITHQHKDLFVYEN